MGPSEIISELKAKSHQQRELIVAAESELQMGIASAKEALNYRASEERKLHPEIVGTAEEALFHSGGALILNQELLDLLNSIHARLEKAVLSNAEVPVVWINYWTDYVNERDSYEMVTLSLLKFSRDCLDAPFSSHLTSLSIRGDTLTSEAAIPLRRWRYEGERSSKFLLLHASSEVGRSVGGPIAKMLEGIDRNAGRSLSIGWDELNQFCLYWGEKEIPYYRLLAQLADQLMLPIPDSAEGNGEHGECNRVCSILRLVKRYDEADKALQKAVQGR